MAKLAENNSKKNNTKKQVQPEIKMPHSFEAEAAVLGAMLFSNKNISRAIEMLEPDCFYFDDNKKIYNAIIKLYERNHGVDILTVSEFLNSEEGSEDNDYIPKLMEISTYVANSANFEDYLRIVLEKFIKRKLIEASHEIIRNSIDESTDALEEIDRAEAKIFSIAEKRMKKSYFSLRQLAKETYEIIEATRKQDKLHSHSLYTGYNELDNILGGFHRSDLIIIAARPSMGKTAFAMSIARNMALLYKYPVAFFSLEMTANQLVVRLISSEARIDQNKIKKGIISHEEESRIVEAVGTIAELPIFIDDSPSLTVMEIRAKARRMKVEHNIKAVFIDYLQLINPPKAESREREISLISRALKQMAKELDIPVIALAQLNRDVEKRNDKRPMLSDLRESGSIEQDADVVMFVHRPEHYGIQYFDKEKKYSTANKAEIIVGKQRNGPTDTVRLNFIKQFTRFENPAYDDEIEEPITGSISQDYRNGHTMKNNNFDNDDFDTFEDYDEDKF